MISNQKIYKLIKTMQNTFLIIHSIIKTKKIAKNIYIKSDKLKK